MSEEKWNRFAATGSVKDYLEYRADRPQNADGAGHSAKNSQTAGEEQAHGADGPAEWNGTLCNAHWGL